MAPSDAYQELFGGVAPVNWSGSPIALGEEPQDATFDVARAGKVVRHQHLPLEDAEHDFDLVQPRGVNRQPMETDLEAQSERTIQASNCFGARVDLLSRMRWRTRIRLHQRLANSICLKT
jgi:hypothetical protein